MVTRGIRDGRDGRDGRDCMEVSGHLILDVSR